MRVIRAEVMGLCFGVRDALEVVEGIAEPATVTIHGELVHNEIVQGRLAARGFATRGEARRGESPPETPAVLITAHGISDRERRRLEAEGKRLIDTTCPLVARVHQAALALQAAGYHVLVIGRRGHVEVEGIVGDLDDPHVIGSEEEVGLVSASPAGDRLPDDDDRGEGRADPGGDRRAESRGGDQVRGHGLPADEGTSAGAGAAAGSRRTRSWWWVAGIRTTHASWRRVAAIAASPRCTSSRRRSWIPSWFKGFATVGLTAGTSTLSETIEEVHRTLVWIGTDAAALAEPASISFLGVETEIFP